MTVREGHFRCMPNPHRSPANPSRVVIGFACDSVPGEGHTSITTPADRDTDVIADTISGGGEGVAFHHPLTGQGQADSASLPALEEVTGEAFQPAVAA